MAEVLKGNIVAKEIKEQMKNKLTELEKDNKYPTLGIIRLGNNPGDVSYEKSIIKACDAIGIKSNVYEEETSLDTKGLIELMEKLNNDVNISGILVFRPLPKHIDEEAIKNAINPDKDVDCMHPKNLGRIFEGDMTGFQPCTPKAAMEVLLFNEVPSPPITIIILGFTSSLSM